MNLAPSHVSVGVAKVGKNDVAIIPAPAVTIRNLGEILSAVKEVEQTYITRTQEMCESHLSRKSHHTTLFNDIEDLSVEAFWAMRKCLNQFHTSPVRVWYELEQRTSRHYMFHCWWRSILAEVVRVDLRNAEYTPIHRSIH